MRRNSICLVNPTVLIKRPVSELACVLKKRGWDVAILTPRRRDSSGDDVSHHTSLLKGIKVYSYRTVSPPVGFEWPVPWGGEFKRLVRKLSREYRVFQVWTHFYLSVLRLVDLLSESNRVVLTMDTLPAYTFRVNSLIDLVFRIYTRTLGRRLFNKVDVIHVYGRPLKFFLDKWKVKTPVHVIPTGILPQRIERSSFRRELGLKGRFVVAFVGLINHRKGVDILLDVARDLPDVSFVVVGDGPYRSRFEQDASSLDNVFFTGPRKDVLGILKDSDVFILPSRGEGIPGVVYESMLCGTPVVASDIPCVDAQVKDGREGFLCPLEDVDCFASRIRKLRDDGLRRSFSRSCRKRIESFYWDGLIDDYLELYS